MINQLILPQKARARACAHSLQPQKDDVTGCCLSHINAGGNRILVASCSTDLWGIFLKRTLHAWLLRT